jgi:septum formation protein
MSRTFVLASASPARFQLLTTAGLHPLVQVSHVDEDAIADTMPGIATMHLVMALATAKGEAVRDDLRVTDATNALIVAADSMLEFEGQSLGKPGTPEEAIRRWQAMRGKRAVLHTGHWMFDQVTGQTRIGVAGAHVHFTHVEDDEIEAYVASGEPLNVAGAFTHEGRSAAYIEKIDGDGPAVGGISLVLLRAMARDIGITWHSLWSGH